MITHYHVRFQLPDTKPPVSRDVILPDSILLGDINQIISVCFGWPLTNAYEFVPQQTGTTYLGSTESFVGSRHTLEADNIPLTIAFQKNRELIYYCGTATTDQVSITMLSTKSLLPDPVFKLEHYQGKNRPCSLGGTPFTKQKVIDDLQLLCEDLYLLPDEFDYNAPSFDDLHEEFKILDKLNDPDAMNELLTLMQGLPEEDAIEFLGQLMSDFRNLMEHSCTLKECLSTLKKEELSDIMRCNHLKGFSKLRRAELEDVLLKKLTSLEFLQEQFRTLTSPEIFILQTLCQHNMTLDGADNILHADYLLRHGLCFRNHQDLFLTLPIEMRPLYQQLIQDKDFMISVQFYDMLHTFCYAAVYFYGAYPIRHLLRKINETTQMVIPVDELEKTIGPAMHDRNDYVLRDGWIIAAELAQDKPESQNMLEQLKAIQNQRTDFFWPDLHQMEPLIFSRRLADEDLCADFIDTFERYLLPGLHMAQAVAAVEYWMRSNVPFEEVFQRTTSDLFALPNQEIARVMHDQLQKIYNRTPLWSLGGYTIEQMREKEAKTASKQGGKIISFQEHLNRKKQK